MVGAALDAVMTTLGNVAALLSQVKIKDPQIYDDKM